MHKFFVALASALLLTSVSLGAAVAQESEPAFYDCVVVATSNIEVDGISIPVQFSLHFKNIPENYKATIASDLPEELKVESVDCQRR
ncbi:MAG: hypothetical protein K8F91_07515 [Candidatus Obscuribacterales bacterium]|nr:hypothetical protein [Candidatus Obscuribacterales bacterium]